MSYLRAPCHATPSKKLLRSANKVLTAVPACSSLLQEAEVSDLNSKKRKLDSTPEQTQELSVEESAEDCDQSEDSSEIANEETRFRIHIRRMFEHYGVDSTKLLWSLELSNAQPKKRKLK